METDPNFSPSGSFTFTRDDLAADETMASACYAAALLIFEGLEQRHGADQVRKWVLDVPQRLTRLIKMSWRLG